MSDFTPLEDAERGTPIYVSVGIFSMTDEGLVATVGKDKAVWISDAFEIVGRVRDPHGEGWGKLLRWKDPDNRTHIHMLPDAALHENPAAIAAVLAAGGLKVATKLGDRAQLISYFNAVNVKKRVYVVDRTGWHEISDSKVFVLPNWTFGGVNSEEVIFNRVTASPYSTLGTLENWQLGVGLLVAGHHLAVFAVSVAFAAPLLGPIGMEGGGFNYHGLSSCGKTTLAQASSSVWGRGDSHGFVKTWRSTANGLEGAAVSHSDLPLVLDELGVGDGRDVAAAVYQLSGSSGKMRASKDGSLRRTATWYIMIISTGEVRISDKLLEGGKRVRAGQEVRLLDIPADAGHGLGVFDKPVPDNDPKKLADTIKAAAKTHYGTAGPAFIEALITEGVDTITDIVRRSIAQFRTKVLSAEADGQVQRAADRFALVGVAGELACQFGIVPWKEGAAKTAAETAFAAWLDNRGGTEPGEVRDAIAQVRGFIARFGESRFQAVEAGDDRPIPDRLGWRRGNGSEREWLIPPETWRTTFCEGYDPTMVARALWERAMLRKAADNKFSCVQSTPAAMWLFVIRPT